MLKIGKPTNAYDVLGLPRRATPVQVRARYRQLVRRHRKDVPVAELFKDEQFRDWVNAYLVLTGPQRLDYDRRVRETRGAERAPNLLDGLSQPQLMLLEAEAAFVRRKLNEAAELAREALKQDKRNADGYALLGDILREQGKYNDALTMYNYAIQFQPNNRRYWQLLQEVTALRVGWALPRRYRRERPTPLNRPASAWVGVGLTVLFVELSVLYMRTRWEAIGPFNLPINLIYIAMIDGFLLGLVLAATAIIGPFDDELLWYQVTGFGTETTPIGVLVALPGIVFFWAAPLFYLFIALLDEHLSLSIVISLGVCGLLTIALGALAPENSRLAVYLLGGNFVFFGFLWGWLLGGIRRRVFEH